MNEPVTSERTEAVAAVILEAIGMPRSNRNMEVARRAATAVLAQKLEERSLDLALEEAHSRALRIALGRLRWLAQWWLDGEGTSTDLAQRCIDSARLFAIDPVADGAEPQQAPDGRRYRVTVREVRDCTRCHHEAEASQPGRPDEFTCQVLDCCCIHKHGRCVVAA